MLISMLATSAILTAIGVAEAFPRNPKKLPGKNLQVVGPRLSHKTFRDLRCAGTYDKFAFALAERICDDCYDIYQELDMIPYCRHECYNNAVFKLCVRATVLHDEARLEYADAVTKLANVKDFSLVARHRPISSASTRHFEL